MESWRRGIRWMVGDSAGALALLVLGQVCATAAGAGAVPIEWPPPAALLPPAPAWEGDSHGLTVGPDDPWVTPAERSGLRTTPRYDETVAWLERLCDAAPELHLVTLGDSPEGRAVWMVVASADLAVDPDGLRGSGKPTLLVQAGIHAGEIDGKDAGMMLLRDMTVRGTQRGLLERANLLFIPILNVDGHERYGPWSRINQRGPVQSGWRTTARNLNLNRDYAKLDAPEMRHLVRALQVWQPDLYVDVHVTDGVDYQYDITWGWNGDFAYSPNLTRWLDRRLSPALRDALEDAGHVPGPLVFAVDPLDLSKGIVEWTATPRYSNGYGDARHLPTVLVENHSLKPYPQRVLGTYVFLATALETLGRHGGSLRRAVAKDRERRPREVVLEWTRAAASRRTIDFRGIEAVRSLSPISGGLRVQWTGRPVRQRIPYPVLSEPARTVRRPRAYWIPPAWRDIAERLAWHGVALDTITSERAVEVTRYRIRTWELEEQPFEGHVRVLPNVEAEKLRLTLPKGSYRVSTDQALGDLAILLLEPEAPDSFFRWGFFMEVLQRTEYAEGYVLEPLAQRMLESDPELRRAFEARLQRAPAFAGDPEARLRWFYERSPYFDPSWRVYPIVREE